MLQSIVEATPHETNRGGQPKRNLVLPMEHRRAERLIPSGRPLLKDEHRQKGVTWRHPFVLQIRETNPGLLLFQQRGEGIFLPPICQARFRETKRRNGTGATEAWEGADKRTSRVWLASGRGGATCTQGATTASVASGCPASGGWGALVAPGSAAADGGAAWVKGVLPTAVGGSTPFTQVGAKPPLPAP